MSMEICACLKMKLQQRLNDTFIVIIKDSIQSYIECIKSISKDCQIVEYTSRKIPKLDFCNSCDLLARFPHKGKFIYGGF